MSVASSSASSAASTIKCPMPVEPGSRGEPIKVQSNLFGIIMDQQVRTLYRYDVTIYGTGREVEDFDDPTVSPIFFTKKTASDAISTERKARAGAALFLALEEIPTIIKESLFYDYQSILFSTEKLEPMPIKKLLKVDDSTSGGAFKGFKLIAVEVKKCSAVSEITTDAYRHLDNSVAAINRDRSVLQFLEIAMNQHPLLHPHEFLVFEKGKIYLKKPGDFGVSETELKRLPDGKELKVGSQKNIMYVEGPSGRNKINIGLAFDAKKAAFHISGQKCSEKAMEILRNFDFGRTCTSEQLFQLECVFKGLLVEAMHTKRRYKIQRVTADATKTITFDGVDMTIADYFMKKHNIRLQAPYAPLFVMQTKKEVMMPLEMCMVVDDQRVGILQQTPVQMRETTRECAVNPLRRQTMIMTNFRALGLNQEKLPSDPGFKLLANPMMVDGRRLPCPQLMYARSAAAIVDPQRFSWRHPRGIPFLHPGKIKCWAIYGVSNRRASFDLKRLADRIQQEASGRGITIPPVGDVDWVSPQRLQEGLFPYLISHNVDYVMFAMDEELSLQDDIKYLERKHSIVTQNMKLRTAREIVEKGKGATVENLCNKMNLKLGGINFTIKMNGERFLHDNRTLVIGIGTNTPPPGAVLEGNGGKKKGDMPSIVGFAANVGEHVETFCGDFDFVEARNEDAQLVGSIVVKHAVEAWMKYDRPIPDRIVIYRAGLASGSFDKLLQVEIPAIRARLAELKCPSRLTYIIAAKDHSIRLFLPQINQNARGPEQNVMSGTVVDSQLTNPKLKQFYLNSHVTLQGSAATPLYTILYDENDFTMDSIEKFTYDLCFLHEIVNLPTSIPTPLYVANRYADRGRRLVAYDVAHDTNSSSSFSVDSDKVRERVQYKFSPFSDRRINA